MPYVAIVPYADRIYANAYWDDRLANSAWSAATDDNKDRALKQATTVIDTLDFVGYKTSETQVRQFPRNDDTDVPDEVLQATCEIAAVLLSGTTLDSVVGGKAGIASESIGDASVSYTGAGRAGAFLSATLGTLSPVAARLLAPWLRDEDSIRVDRVS